MAIEIKPIVANNRIIKHKQFLKWLKRIEDNSNSAIALQIISPPMILKNLPTDWQRLNITQRDLLNGIALLSHHTTKIAIAPPFPFEYSSSYNDLENLHRHWLKPRIAAVLLLRLGRYAIGASSNGLLTSSKIGSRYVKAKHKKGGQSALRFTRNRLHWIKELFDEVNVQFNKHIITPMGNNVDCVFIGGDKIVLKQFLDQAAWPTTLVAKIQKRRLTATQANKRALETAVDEAWSAHTWDYPTT